MFDTYFFSLTIFPSLSIFSELRSSSCGNPGVPPKGILNGTQFNVGDKIRYRCVTGYVLDGHSLLTCVNNAASVSVWDFPVPICRGEFFSYKSVILTVVLSQPFSLQNLHLSNIFVESIIFVFYIISKFDCIVYGLPLNSK